MFLERSSFFAPIVNPRYLYVFTFSNLIPFVFKSHLQNPLPRLKTMHLVFDSLIVRFFHRKKETNAFILCWSSSCDRARTIKSSAYINTLIMSISDSFIFGSLTRFKVPITSLMYRLNKRELKGQPCLTPLAYLKELVISPLTLIAHLVLLYIFYQIK